MSEKTISMTFGNGVTQSVKVGDSIYVVTSFRRTMGETLVITKLGNKYITAGTRGRQLITE